MAAVGECSDAHDASPKKAKAARTSKDVTFASSTGALVSSAVDGDEQPTMSVFGGRGVLPADREEPSAKASATASAPLEAPALAQAVAQARAQAQAPRFVAPPRGSLLARLVSQLFSRDRVLEDKADFLLEGMPVGTIRKLVARQVRAFP